MKSRYKITAGLLILALACTGVSGCNNMQKMDTQTSAADSTVSETVVETAAAESTESASAEESAAGSGNADATESADTVSDTQPLTCPFTTLTFNSSYEDMIALEGEDFESYDSVYNGLTYTYSKVYQGQDGLIKYMFNDDKELLCIAWTYSGTSNEELDTLYNTIHSDVVEKYGESGYDSAVATNYGDVWYLDDGHIILSVMATDAQKALQYAYQSPKASEEADIESAETSTEG